MRGEEEWRQVVGWEGLYEVSSLGRVRSLDRVVAVTATGGHRAPKKDYTRPLRGKTLAQAKRSDGYMKVSLYRDGEEHQVSVHRLVCAAFNGLSPAHNDAAHNNGIKTDNRAENLRWATRSANLADRDRHGTDQRGERGPSAKLTAKDVACIRSVLANRWHGQKVELARKYGVSKSAIYLIAKGTNWKQPA